MTQQDENEKIALRVKKLLAMSASSNQHEADAMMAKAMELLTQHNLSIQYVESVEERETDCDKFVRRPYMVGKAISHQQKMAAPVVNKFFFCNPILTKGGFLFVGRESNVEIAVHVFEFLSQTFERLWVAYRTETKARGVNVSGGMKIEFINGLQIGLIKKLAAERASLKQEQALAIIDDKLRTAVSQLVGQTKQVKGANFAGWDDAMAAGVRQGQQISIRYGLQSTGHRGAVTGATS